MRVTLVPRASDIHVDEDVALATDHVAVPVYPPLLRHCLAAWTSISSKRRYFKNDNGGNRLCEKRELCLCFDNEMGNLLERIFSVYTYIAI